MGNYIQPILVLIIAFIGLGLITGVVSRSRAMNGVWTIVLIALFWPFAASFAINIYKSLPLWVVITASVLASLIVVSALFRGILTIFVGREATGVFVGELLLRMAALPFRFMGYLFRLVSRR